ncbi:MAG: Thiol:disulfide interchange protein DsbD [Calditrichaeota bacterium]|nr:Thiol:disulfide interchange protein DsbD [Calditrichota bacterium]
MKRPGGWTLLLVTVLLAATAAGQPDPVEPPVPVEIVPAASGVEPGGMIELAYVLDVPADHHVTDKSYGLFYFEPEFPPGFGLADTTWPEGEVEKGEEVYRGRVTVVYELAVEDTVTPGDYEIPYAYGYQICRDLPPEKCYLPNGGDGVFTLTVLAEGVTAIPSGHEVFAGEAAATAGGDGGGGEESGALEDRLTRALESGSVWAFVLVFFAGILISFTPCVYPMIPVIIGYVGSSAGGNRMKGFILSIFFVLGLAVVYAVLGVIAGATGALFGAFMQNPVVLWFIVAVFVALGASMLGAFDITVPAAVQERMMTGERSGVIGAVLIGGVTGIVAAPCAGPPLLVLLSWIGNTGNLVLGFFLMATFALGIGVLFVVIGTFAGAITALPQAGPWMDKIKKALGVVIFAVALYYLNILIAPDIFLLVLGAFLLLLGLFLGAAKRWEELTTAGRYGKGFGVLALLAGAFYFLLGLAQVNDVNLGAAATVGAGPGATTAAVEEQHVPWNVNAYDDALATASADNKPVLIDFYADWCGVCVELDHLVWNQREVIDAADGYIPLKLDFTRPNAELEALRKKHGVGGLPTVLILGPDGEERSRFNEFRPPEEVARWLERHAGA